MDIKVIGEYAAAVASIIGVLSILVYKPLKRIYDGYIANVKESRESDAKILRKLDDLDKQVSDLTVDVQMISHDRLAQKRRYLMDRGHASTADKQDAARWYEMYTSHGGNHLAASYMDDIIGLPEE